MAGNTDHHTPRAFRVTLQQSGKDFLVYPDHSPASILHNYIKACDFKMKFEYGNSQNQHSATVFIQGASYATGYGQTKMVAKQSACKLCLQIIIPQIKEYWIDDSGISMDGSESEEEIGATSVVGMDVISLCLKLDEPFPYKCLEICLKRNFGFHGLDVKELKTTYVQVEIGYQCILTIQDTTGEGIGESKKMAREIAAKNLLMELHPVVPNFTGILELYGKKSSTSQYLERREQEKQKVINCHFRDDVPAKVNFQLLAKLREEMRKCSKNTAQ